MMVQQKDIPQGLIVGGMAGTLGGALAGLFLAKPALAAPENSEAALNYLIELEELQARALARLVELAEMYPGVPGLPPMADSSMRSLLKAKFFADRKPPVRLYTATSQTWFEELPLQPM